MRKLFFLGLCAFALPFAAFALTPFDITYPIAELGNCADGAACKAYCDDLSHKNECADFAVTYGFVKKEDAEKVKNLPTVGPGGCTSQAECKAYCDDAEHQDECLAFAEEHGLLGARGQEVKERAHTIRNEGGPGSCQSEKECRAYCENPSHMDVCIDFAVAKGYMTKEEADKARKGAQLAQAGGPGGCKGEKECRAYCESPEHFESCLAFAEEHDLMPKTEVERIRKMGPPKPGPGGCKGDECRQYCEDPAHHEECIRFAIENGHMSKEEGERALKMTGKTGPGGCKGDECRKYCDNPAHQDECLQFAIDNDLIPPQEIERIKKFKEVSGPGGCRGEECRKYCDNPAHQDECMQFARDNGLMSDEEFKMAQRGRDLSQKVKEVGGPGGCKSDQECQMYCKDPSHVEACLAFAVEHGGFTKGEAEQMLKQFVNESQEIRREFRPGGPPEDFQRFEQERFQKFEEFRAIEMQYRGPQMMEPGQFKSGPGGCMSPEECIKYCSDPAHHGECGIISGSIHSGSTPQGEFGGPGMGGPGMTMGTFAGPGGCTGPAECVKYCSDSNHREECAKFNPSMGAPPPGEMFRQVPPGSESGFRPPLEQNTISGTETCSGPKPLMPVPEGCTGPVCKYGKWEFLCPEGQRIPPPLPGGAYNPSLPPPPGGTYPTGSGAGAVCTQEWKPVCGTNNRTYPNVCFAKLDNASVAKEGPCEGFGETLPPPGSTYPQPYPSPDQQYQQQYQQQYDQQYQQQYQQPPPDGTYYQQPPPPDGSYQQPPPPPPSGNLSPPPFASVLGAFLKLFLLR